jgi:hypothetical protein
MTFREMLDLAVLLDDAVTEAVEIHQKHQQQSCCGFWGMDEWHDAKTQFEVLCKGLFAAEFSQ